MDREYNRQVAYGCGVGVISSFIWLIIEFYIIRLEKYNDLLESSSCRNFSENPVDTIVNHHIGLNCTLGGVFCILDLQIG
jgi:hypothetical protein